MQNKRLLLVFFLGFCFLGINKYLVTPFTIHKSAAYTSFLSLEKTNKINNLFRNQNMAGLLSAYVTGNKKNISKKIRDHHRRLSLYHLFTPSGIHLSSILLLFFPFLSIIREKSKILYRFLSISIVIPFLFLPQLYSIKRLAIMRIIYVLSQMTKQNIPIFYIFLMTFLVDCLVGSGLEQFASFSYSFLFLGIIITNQNHSRLTLILSLWMGQLLVAFFSENDMIVAGPFLGFFLTSLFAFMFPLFFLTYFLPFQPLISGSEYLLGMYTSLVQICSETSFFWGQFRPHILHALLVFILVATTHSRLRSAIIFSFLLLSTQPLLNTDSRQKATYLNSWNTVNLQDLEIADFKLSPDGINLKLRDHSHCKLSLHLDAWQARCRIKTNIN